MLIIEFMNKENQSMKGLMSIKENKLTKKMIYKSICKVNIILRLNLIFHKKFMMKNFHQNMESMKLQNQNMIKLN